MPDLLLCVLQHSRRGSRPPCRCWRRTVCKSCSRSSAFKYNSRDRARGRRGSGVHCRLRLRHPFTMDSSSLGAVVVWNTTQPIRRSTGVSRRATSQLRHSLQLWRNNRKKLSGRSHIRCCAAPVKRFLCFTSAAHV